MAKALTNDQDTIQQRTDALERIQRLRERVSTQNSNLTTEQAEEIAEALGQAAIRSLKERGEISFQRDKS